jgi:hypothetical protein
MVGISSTAVADDFGIYTGATPLGMLQLFQNHDTSAFCHDKAIAVTVKGPTRLWRRVIPGG